MKVFFRRLYLLCKPFWTNKQNWLAWLVLSVVIGIGSIIAFINVKINEWSKTFYDVLASLETDKLYSLMSEYLVYLAIFVVINVYRTWLRKWLIIRWRTAMTEQFIEQWLNNQLFYKLAHQRKMDNPDQRIAEDIRLFIEYSIELTVSFLFNAIQLYSFLMILWNLSGSPQFTILGETFTIKGYLVWVALVYAILGTIITHLIGRKLHHLNYQQQVYEATFRSSLIRKQDNAEQIALYQGEKVEQNSLANEFAEIVKNWRLLMNRERNLGFFTVGYSRFANLLPVLFAIPLLLAKIVTFGGIMQIRSAFSVVLDAFSWFIYAYSILPKWSAAITRLSQLTQEMENLAKQQKVLENNQQNQVICQNLTLFTPDNQPLLKDISLELNLSQWIYLKGKSGLGKSTLLRTLNGIWDFYSGRFSTPEKTSIFIPQKSYLNDGTLAEVLSYPQIECYSDKELKQVLNLVGLSQWQDRLNEKQSWKTLFSGGEQQRIAFARLLLARPEIIYLDEATSHLDETSANKLLSLIKQHLPSSTVIYISHQQSLAEFADIEVDLSQFS